MHIVCWFRFFKSVNSDSAPRKRVLNFACQCCRSSEPILHLNRKKTWNFLKPKRFFCMKTWLKSVQILMVFSREDIWTWPYRSKESGPPLNSPLTLSFICTIRSASSRLVRGFRFLINKSEVLQINPNFYKETRSLAKRPEVLQINKKLYK